MGIHGMSEHILYIPIPREMSILFMEILSGRHLTMAKNNVKICDYERNIIMKETYENLEMETIVFDVEDVIATSNPELGGGGGED